MAQHPSDSQSLPKQRYALQFERFSAFVEEYTSLLSLGGMFLKTESPAPVGTSIGFEVKLTDGFRLIQGSGEVMWVRPQTTGPGLESGMGFRFDALDENGRELVLKILEEQVKGGGQPFDVDEVPPDVAAQTAAAQTATAPPPGSSEAGIVGSPVGGPTVGAVSPEDFSEEATLVTQRSSLMGPSEGVDFAAPWESLPDQVPQELAQDQLQSASAQDLEAVPEPVSTAWEAASDDRAESSGVPQPGDSGLENPFAMVEDPSFDDFEDLPDLDDEDDLVLESEAELSLDATASGFEEIDAGGGDLGDGDLGDGDLGDGDLGDGDLGGDDIEGMEFETGTEMALNLDDSMASAANLAGPAADFDFDPEAPTVVGDEVSRAANELLAAGPPETLGAELRSDPVGLPSLDASPERLPSTTAFSTTAPDPFATHPPESAPRIEDLQTPPYDPSQSLDSTEHLEAGPVVENAGPWVPPAAESNATEPFVYPNPPAVEAPGISEPPSGPYAASADDYDMQDYDLEAPPKASGLGAALGRSKLLLASLALVLLVGAAYSMRHQLTSMFGLDGKPVQQVGGQEAPTLSHALGSGSDLADDPPSIAEGASVEEGNSTRNFTDDGLSDADMPTPNDEIPVITPSVDAQPTADNPLPQAPRNASIPTAEVKAPDTVEPVATSSAPVNDRRPTADRASRIVDISSRTSGDSTVVTIELDGALASSDVIFDALSYNTQRQQFRLLGIEFPYQATISVASRQLTQIRTGLHGGSAGGELRLVFDFPSASLTASDYRLVGQRLEITVRSSP